MQPTLSFPPDVYRLAQNRGLGTPLTEYKGPKPRSRFEPGFCGVLVAVLIGGYLAAGVPSFTLLALLGVKPFWPYPVLTVVVMVAGYVAITLWWRQRNPELFAIYLCSDGLLWHRVRQSIAIRWDDIQAVWRQTGIVVEQRVITGYMVQPHHGAKAAFSLFTSDWTPGFTGLGQAIEEEIVRRRLPQALSTIQGGGQLEFGPLGVTASGLLQDGKLLSWDDMTAVQVDRWGIQIKQRPADWLWYDRPFDAVPNVAVCIALLNSIRGTTDATA